MCLWHSSFCYLKLRPMLCGILNSKDSPHQTFQLCSWIFTNCNALLNFKRTVFVEGVVELSPLCKGCTEKWEVICVGFTLKSTLFGRCCVLVQASNSNLKRRHRGHLTPWQQGISLQVAFLQGLGIGNPNLMKHKWKMLNLL